MMHLWLLVTGIGLLWILGVNSLSHKQEWELDVIGLWSVEQV